VTGRRLRKVAPSFAVAGPGGMRVRTRLRLSAQDEAVLRAAGRHLGSLAAADLAARCAEGRLDAKGRAVSRAARKSALTAASSSRWAGTITRTTEDQWQLSWRNQTAGRGPRLRHRGRPVRQAGQAAGSHSPPRRGRAADRPRPGLRPGRRSRSCPSPSGELARTSPSNSPELVWRLATGLRPISAPGSPPPAAAIRYTAGQGRQKLIAVLPCG
jgi:hypothetical protein